MAAVAVGAASCVDGEARLACAFTDCNGECVDVMKSREHCGACGVSCKSGQVCSAGTCEASCADGLSPCEGGCTDTNTDRNNCGECGTVCADGLLCDGAGQCGLSCQPGQTDCDGICTNTDSDAANCGECGNPCEAGMICNGSGECALSCQTGLTDCGGTCTNTASDNAHCGECDNACDPGEICDGNGECAVSCQTELDLCGGLCTNTATDNAHCGVCNNACDPGELCCGSQCRTTATDNAHCGGCGNMCMGAETCSDGECTTSTVRMVDGTVLPVSYQLCGAAGACTANAAKTACAALGYKVVSHASDGTTEVKSLGATTSCNFSTGYFTAPAGLPGGACLVGISNLEWSSCCGTTNWHGNTIAFGAPGVSFGFIQSGNSGFDAGEANVGGTSWGCTTEATAASNLGGCTSHYVACTP